LPWRKVQESSKTLKEENMTWKEKKAQQETYKKDLHKALWKEMGELQQEQEHIKKDPNEKNNFIKKSDSQKPKKK